MVSIDNLPRPTDLLKLLGVAVLYALLAKIVLTFFSANGVVSIVWPPSGLALAVLLMGGNRYAGGVFLGAFIANAMTGLPLGTVAMIATGNTLEAVVGAWLLTRDGKFDPDFRSLHDYSRLIVLAGFFGASVSAISGSTALLVSGFLISETYFLNLLHWWMGDALGILLITPLMLVWRSMPKDWFEPRRLAEVMLVLGLAFLIGQVVFLDWFHDTLGKVAQGYWMFLFVTWAAVRLGIRGVLVLILMVAVQALVGAAQGTGFFSDDMGKTQMSNYWFYMVILSISGTALATYISERKRAEDRLRQSEDKLRGLYELAPLGIALTDMQGHFLDFNDAFARICGYSVVELKRLDYWTLTPREYAESEDAQLETLSRSGRYGPYEKEYLRKDGSRIPIRLNGVLVTGRDGQSWIWSIIEDISERKRTEAEMFAVQSELAAMLDALPDLLFELDLDGYYLDCRASRPELLAAPPDVLLGKTLREVLAPEAADECMSALCEAHETGHSYGRQIQLQVPQGERWFELSVARKPVAAGEAPRFIMLSRDITKRKLAESALHESEQRYRMVFENSPVSIWEEDFSAVKAFFDDLRKAGVADIDAYFDQHPETIRQCAELVRIVDVNHAALVLHEATSKEQVLAGLVNLFTAESFDSFRQELVCLWNGEIRMVKDATVKTLAGDSRNVTVYYSVCPGYEETLSKVIVSLSDVTERKRSEAALQAMRAEMEQLMRFHVASQTVSALAHELHQPLNAVTSYAEAALRLLRAGNPQPERLLHAIESSTQQAQRAGQVVRELLAFMKQGEVQTEPVDLNDLVQRVLDRIRADGYGGFQTRLQLEPDLAPVTANRLQVEKVLVNIIENGVEAMRDAGISIQAITITVRTNPEGPMAQVTVRDSGPGIDRQTLHRIFDPFFTTKPKGLGMGLAISRAIIELHGGQLWVESEPGSGASFHFTLPFVS